MRPERRLLLSLLCLSAAAASGARADEVIKTGADGAPPSAEAPAGPIATDEGARATGVWARGILSGQPVADAKPSQGQGCEAPADRKPHGEVWAGVGTGGYRTLGGVVTQPIGACGQATIAISHTEGGLGGTWRRR
ncbi:MAG: hypothetical protein JWQ97_4123 [Phenylobacterium sp.]|nr:hypothetical protein [Phenylobacterium sp.]